MKTRVVASNVVAAAVQNVVNRPAARILVVRDESAPKERRDRTNLARLK